MPSAPEWGINGQSYSMTAFIHNSNQSDQYHYNNSDCNKEEGIALCMPSYDTPEWSGQSFMAANILIAANDYVHNTGAFHKDRKTFMVVSNQGKCELLEIAITIYIYI